ALGQLALLVDAAVAQRVEGTVVRDHHELVAGLVGQDDLLALRDLVHSPDVGPHGQSVSFASSHFFLMRSSARLGRARSTHRSSSGFCAGSQVTTTSPAAYVWHASRYPAAMSSGPRRSRSRLRMGLRFSAPLSTFTR